MSTRIFARSPYIISVNETGMTSSKLELFLYNGNSVPSSPTYILSKNIPHTVNKETFYDVSPYIREYISFANLDPVNISTGYTNETTKQCKLRVKRYKNTGTLLNTVDYYCFDGYTLYLDGANYDNEMMLMSEGTYYYHYDSVSTWDVKNPGDVTVHFPDTASYTMKWTNLVSGATHTQTHSGSEAVKRYPRVLEAYWSAGNKFEVFITAGMTLVKSLTMKPLEECKYTPVVVDFVNKFGGAQRVVLFKASNNTIDVKKSEYNKFQSTPNNYDTLRGTVRSTNHLVNEVIKCNSGYVDESFSSVLEELLMSERILVNDKPAVMKTTNIEKVKHINTRLINYTLEFTFAFNTNNIIR